MGFNNGGAGVGRRRPEGNVVLLFRSFGAPVSELRTAKSVIGMCLILELGLAMV